MKPKMVILIGAKCMNCDPHGLGAKTGTFYGKTYPLARWMRKPKCVNCKTRMTKLWETRMPLEVDEE